MSSVLPERLPPWLLVVPALVLATPFSPLDGDPYPHLAGTGLDLVLLVPLALLALVRGWNTPRALPFLLALAWAFVAWRLAPGTDTLEARRALGVLALFVLAFTGGNALDERGRATFAWLLVALSLAWTGLALARGFAGDSCAGTLGDTGSLSQAALPGAAVAALWAAGSAGWKRRIGLVALAAFLVHSAAAPVVAGSHALLAALLLAAWRGAGRGRAPLSGLALVALVAPFVGQAAREVLREGDPATASADSGPERSLGGLPVRGLVWRASLGLVAEQPLLGAGPGQFQAAFPPHRYAREIELSRHGACAELDTEVEHAHNDWLQGFCELGLVGGALLALGLALAARDALRALGHAERAPLAAAAAALLVNAVVHAPLSGNPAAGPLALAVLGALAPRAPASRLRALLACSPALLALAWAPDLLTHGGALRAYVESARRIEELARGGATEDPRGRAANELAAELSRARVTLDVALAAAPDSAPARALRARLVDDEEGSAAWDRLLEVRPHSVEAWEQSATVCARRGETAPAHERYQRALSLSPTHPRILRNAARLELTQGAPELGLELVERLRAQGCPSREWQQALGRELVLELGLPERGAHLLFEKPLEELVPEELHALGRTDDPDAEAGECVAQLLWARQHAERGDFELALRNYRQARDKSHGSRPAPAPLYVLELAAAEVRAGRREEALQHVEGLRFDAATWDRLAGWARAGLQELGLERSSGARPR